MKNIPLLLCASLGVLACNEQIPPVETRQTDNAQAQVSKLFTHDGCTVYRFYDEGYARYFTHCKTGSVSTLQSERHSQSCGKGCVTTYDVPNDIVTVKDSAHD